MNPTETNQNKAKRNAARPRSLGLVVDKLAEWGITIAGVTVILAMLAMLVLIVREAAPLFYPVTMRMVGVASLPDDTPAGDVLALATDADLRGRSLTAAVVLRDGRCGFTVVNGEAGGAGDAPFTLTSLPGAPADGKVVRADEYGNRLISVLWDDGTAILYAFAADFSGTTPKGTFTPVLTARFDGKPDFALLRGSGDRTRAVAVYPDGVVVEQRREPGKGLLGRAKSVETTRKTVVARGGTVLTAALNDDGVLYLGTDQGNLAAVDFSREEITTEITPAFRDRRPITALTFLNGGYALAVGDGQGGVSVWFPRREDGHFRLRRSVRWDDTGAPVVDMTVSGRDRGVMAVNDAGAVRWLYSTTGRTLLDADESMPRSLRLALNERADTLAALREDGTVALARVNAHHPEAGWTGFFVRILYEGYEKPAYVWQSTGSDASEPKLSLVPLVWGSIKAAVFALFFATPIALAAAVYLSQFARPEWRARLKPAIEMVAAVPSVVIGFLAALWLAPLLEGYLGVLVQHVHYDQRNALVIAIAMGFAVIPTVFSLAEDSLSAVPPSLAAASLALGASKWQTVARVVVPTASPGIFTAVMLGFGRAVGETMIVLMAAGNTPILSLSPFDGMRTLSANIAVEMPEAPVGGTLYRTLFLCALLLFVLTLAVNAAAEILRNRLRRRYGRV